MVGVVLDLAGIESFICTLFMVGVPGASEKVGL